MQCLIYRHAWGLEDRLSPALLDTFVASSFAGVEAGFASVQRLDPSGDELTRRGLRLIGQVYTAGFDRDRPVAEHLDNLERELEALADRRPTLVNIHGGDDGWSLDDMHLFMDGALRHVDAAGVHAAFETHRGRCLFHPTPTRLLLEAFPELRLVADLSHFVCVCERLALRDDLIDLIASRTVHVHCRVGYIHGPQVNDPRAAAWHTERETFTRWWRTIARAMATRGEPFSCCPEYGPVPYQPTHPSDHAPLADVDAVVRWQADQVRTLVS